MENRETVLRVQVRLPAGCLGEFALCLNVRDDKSPMALTKSRNADSSKAPGEACSSVLHWRQQALPARLGVRWGGFPKVSPLQAHPGSRAHDTLLGACPHRKLWMSVRLGEKREA